MPSMQRTGFLGRHGSIGAGAPPPLSAPLNITPPIISGTGLVGQTLTVSNVGAWAGYPVPTFAYQWRRNGSNIGGAMSSSYALVVADEGANIDCVVTATNSQGSANADSNDIAVSGSVGHEIIWGAGNPIEWGAGNSLIWGT